MEFQPRPVYHGLARRVSPQVNASHRHEETHTRVYYRRERELKKKKKKLAPVSPAAVRVVRRLVPGGSSAGLPARRENTGTSMLILTVRVLHCVAYRPIQASITT